MKQYQTVKQLSDEQLNEAYAELNQEKLPAKDASIIRRLHKAISKEVGKTIPLMTVPGYVLKEMVDRMQGNR